MQGSSAREETADDVQQIGHSTGAQWYCVHTLPHREAGARQQLINQGFTTFLPRRWKTRRHARKLDRVLTPLFPRYLFVSFDAERDRWRSVNGTYGVARLIMDGERPRAVPRGVVEALLAQADADDVVSFDERALMRPGQEVRLLSGPFVDAIGRLERLDEQGRVHVLLELMGGRVPVTMAAAAVTTN